MPLYGLNVVVSCNPPVSVHHKRNMLRDRSLFERADEDLSQLPYCPCDWRRGSEPLVYARVVNGAHGEIVEREMYSV